MSEDIQIFIPAGYDESRLLDFCLVSLTRAIEQLDSDKVAHGFLGGEHGYGAHWDNHAFTMRPYYWGDCDCGFEQLESAWCESAKHEKHCYQTDYKAIKTNWLKEERKYNKQVEAICHKHGIPYNKGIGCAIHCTCGYDKNWKKFLKLNPGHKETCSLMLPNFIHKASGFKVEWYKYIGRDMKADNPNNTDIAALFRECMLSLKVESKQ